ncbi:MAG: glucose-1-phosphate adenylyltransferase [Nitrospirota bacterium]|nr:glucose-1-phosphate adenylyltransferase [Nitrospirota bacterium]
MQNRDRDNFLTIILAGGEGKRLFPLTTDRVKSAVPFGGAYRIIDFVLSNFVNSGFYKIKVLTQYKSHSLNTHLSRGWRLSPLLDQYIDPVPAQMRTGPHWFQGTADAVFQNLNLILDEMPDHVCIFGGDHIFKMNIRQMVESHISRDATVTVAAIPVSLGEAREFGVIQARDGIIEAFHEKPAHPLPTVPGGHTALASMGNYIFRTRDLIEILREDAETASSKHDFGHNILPRLASEGRAHVYDFSQNTIPGMTETEKGYWRDIGNIDAYWQANMDLVAVTPSFNLYNPYWTIRTYRPQVPPAKFVFADEKNRRIGVATDSIVCGGSIISGGQIDRSILSHTVRVNSYAQVSESVLFDGVDIGRYAKIHRCIVEKGIRVPPDARIGFDQEEDRKSFHISAGGIVVVNQEGINRWSQKNQ